MVVSPALRRTTGKRHGMRIQSIKINSFGKLQNYALDFNDGAACKLLILPNESGKSTIIAFIRACFYGLGDKRAGKKQLARREQYRNFDGTLSSGVITFTYKGQNYELQRKFGKSRSRDEVSLLNLDQAQVVETGGKEPGYFLFNLSEEQFLSTVLVEQMQMALDYKAGSNQELIDALSNLGLTGDSQLNLQKAIDALKEKAKVLQHKRGSGGLIYETEQALEAARKEQTQLLQERDNLVALQVKCNKLSASIARSEQDLQTEREQLLLSDTALALQDLLSEMEQVAADTETYIATDVPVYTGFSEAARDASSSANTTGTSANTTSSQVSAAASMAEAAYPEIKVLNELGKRFDELRTLLRHDQEINSVCQDDFAQIAAELETESANLKRLEAEQLTSDNYAAFHYALKDGQKFLQQSLKNIKALWEKTLTAQRTQLESEIADLRAAGRKALQADLESRTQDEAEYKEAVENSFRLNGQAARLKMELAQLDEQLQLNEQATKKALQRKTAYHTRIEKLQASYDENRQEIQLEQERLQSGESEIKATSVQLATLEKNIQAAATALEEGQRRQKMLVAAQLQAAGFLPVIGVLVTLLFVLSAAGIYFYLQNYNIYLVAACAVAVAVCTGTAFYRIYLQKKRKKEISSLQNDLRNLSADEDELQNLKADAIALQTQKLLLIRDNGHEWLTKLEQDALRLQSEIADFTKNYEHALTEIADLEKEKQAKHLLWLQRKNEYRQAAEKAEFAAATVSKSEEFILNRKQARREQQEHLDQQLKAKQAEVEQLPTGVVAKQAAAAETAYDALAAAIAETVRQTDFEKWQKAWQSKQEAEQERLLRFAHIMRRLQESYAAYTSLQSEYDNLFTAEGDIVGLAASGQAAYFDMASLWRSNIADLQGVGALISKQQVLAGADMQAAASGLVVAVSEYLHKLKATYEAFRALPLFSDVAELAVYRAELRALQAEHVQALENKKLQYSADSRECRILFENLRDPEIAAQRVVVLEQELAAAVAELQTLQNAVGLLENLFLELQLDFSPKVREAASGYLACITADKYNEILLDADLRLYVRYREDGRYHEAEYLSGGSYEQIYLALRLALSALLGADGALPLLLDDSFVQFDAERTEQALRTVRDFAVKQGRQVILFTCHAHYQDYAALL